MVVLPVDSETILYITSYLSRFVYTEAADIVYITETVELLPLSYLIQFI